jgi:DNA polymerase V
MGFPSPAKDYTETTLTLNNLLGLGGNRQAIETSSGYAVIDKTMRCEPGCVVLIATEGRNEFAKVMGGALITEDGEAIEGEALDDVTVMGRVVFLIERMHDHNLPF